MYHWPSRPVVRADIGKNSPKSCALNGRGTFNGRVPHHRTRPRRDERGATAVLAAILAVVLLVLAAMVVELGLARDTRQGLSTSADASALAAGNVLYPPSGSCTAGTPAPCLSDAVAAAKSFAAANSKTPTSAWGSCADSEKLAYVPTGSTPCVSFDSSTRPSRVRVRMPDQAVQTPLGSLAGVKEVALASAAEAQLTAVSAAAGCGLCVLEGASVSGNPGLTVRDAGIHVNGTPSFSGNPTIQVSGGTFTTENAPRISGRPTLYPAPTIAPRISDPLAAVDMPFAVSQLPYFGDVKKSGKDACNLQPGRYDGIQISGQVRCTLAAGLYAIGNGGVQMSGTSGMDASSGVTLYFTCGAGSGMHECSPGYPYVEYGGALAVSGTNDFQIKAPSTGTTKGLAIVYDRNNGSNLDYSGTNQDRLVGSVYAKSATFNLSGTADSANTDSMIVVKKLNLSGNGTIAITYTAANNVVLSSTGVSLVR